ncbi:hypothetical protein Cpir12675_006678 [Ceratocystis pirilliformis]|uniref:Alpha/beta hydrolase fold-3 domain-containing protein n=1 Tax=Ceratocystis pirilliformis TaxID=259994 RepID=A0ABR3YFQ5_9PEZI
MIDHVLGRPSARSRRLQVLAVLSFWTMYLKRGSKHGPPFARILSKFFTRRLTPWQIVTLTIMSLYAAQNFSSLVGLSSPDPLSKMYEAGFFRATWVLTALDAGFWTAMKIKSRRLRDLASVIFTLFYLFAADMADEKVRRVRGNLTIDHMRVSWNKSTSPYLNFLQGLIRPRFMRSSPRQLRIARPSGSDYTEPVTAWLYFDGTLAELRKHRRVLVDIPGGGFVAMDPRCNDDKLGCWASKTGMPILALDYRKAPEFPYPYALNECFDVFTMLVRTKGRCIGLAGTEIPKITISGDSSGGNLAVGTTLMIIERTIGHLSATERNSDLPLPEGLLLFYPSLDMNIGSWMSDEEMSLIRDRSMRRTNRPIVRRKTMQYSSLVGTPHHSDDEDASPPAEKVQKKLPERFQTPRKTRKTKASNAATATSTDFPVPGGSSQTAPEPASTEASATIHRASSFHPQPLRTRLAMSSKISYFSDRVLTPEMMRAMVIMYIGPHNRPDFRTDYLLSPTIAPDSLLSHFPKTFFLTGERDPLVDDTVIFAGRLRQARRYLFDLDAADPENISQHHPDDNYTESDILEMTLLPGISHGFLQFPALYPPAWELLERSAGWIEQSFQCSPGIRRREIRRRDFHQRQAAARAALTDYTTDEEAEDKPLEMNLKRKLRPQQQSPSARKGDGASSSDTMVASQQDGLGKAQGVLPNGSNEPVAWKHKIERLVAKTSDGAKPNLGRLNSEDDLVGRRMQGLTSGLTGLDDD